ncbi:MAG: ATP-binding protein, partial [Puniceicoccales bacterium]
ILGRCHYDVFPDVGEEWKAIHQKCLQGEVAFKEKDSWRPTGWEHDQYLRWEIRPWYESDDKVGGLMMFTEDITEAVLREQELVETREKAEAANRAKSNFLANMSHEIRTPMNSILGFAELLSKEIENPRQKQFLNSIQSSGKTLLGLINDLLDLAKIEAGKIELVPKPVNLRQTFNELMAVFQLQAGAKGVKLRYEISGKLPEFVMIDEFRLSQVLLNLLSNAVKFTSKGTVTLELKVTESNLALDLEFAVADSGCGIPDSFRERAFGKFEQAGDSALGGTGLGLAISSKLVKLMDGKLDYSSKLGVGTRFCFTVSNIYQAAPAVDAMPYHRDKHRLVFPKSTLLLVDDVPENLKLMRAVFDQEENITTVEATGGVQGLEMAQLHQPDLILLDISMPDMDGREVCQRLRQMEGFADKPILAVTASLQKSAMELLEFGFNECLIKPVPPQLLLRSCHRWLNGSTKPVTPKPFADRNSGDVADELLPPDIASALKAEIAGHENGLVLKELEKLATRIEAMADEHNAPRLNEVAKTLKFSAQSFDIAGARQALSAINAYLDHDLSAES